MRLRFRSYRVGREGKYFPERLQRRRQYHVAVRSKVRLQWAGRAALFLMASLAVAAAVMMRRFPLNRFKIPDIPVVLTPRFLRLERASVQGASLALQKDLDRELGPDHPWGFWEPYRAGKRMLQDFPCLKSVRFERHWRAHQILFQMELQRPLARVTRNGQPWGWLSDTGVLFTAPSGVYPDSDWIQVEVGHGGDSAAAPLARFLREALKDGALPARLMRAEFRSPEEGWEIALADDTRVLWGDLDWAPEKLSRLKEVLADAQARGHAGWAADLRYFAEGKILMRPKL